MLVSLSAYPLWLQSFTLSCFPSFVASCTEILLLRTILENRSWFLWAAFRPWNMTAEVYAKRPHRLFKERVALRSSFYSQMLQSRGVSSPCWAKQWKKTCQQIWDDRRCLVNEVCLSKPTSWREAFCFLPGLGYWLQWLDHSTYLADGWCSQGSFAISFCCPCERQSKYNISEVLHGLIWCYPSHPQLLEPKTAKKKAFEVRLQCLTWYCRYYDPIPFPGIFGSGNIHLSSDIYRMAALCLLLSAQWPPYSPWNQRVSFL